MQNYQLIAMDMDGTLLNSKKEISPANRSAIAKAAAVGKTIVLSTGRSLSELKPYLDQLPEIRYLDCASGALIYDLKEKKFLFRSPIAPEVALQIIEIAGREDAMIHLLTERSIIQRNQGEQLERYGMAIYQKLFDTVADKWEDIARQYTADPFPVDKLNLYCVAPQSRERIRQRIQAAKLPVTMAYAETTSLEVSALGVDKGVGLKKLCEILSIPLSKTIVVGDANNDLQGLQIAGLAVAMDNAKNDIKQIADVIVADCDHDGCAEAIYTYLLRV